MKDGVIHQIDRPQSVYDDPANLFVARFLGTPPIDVFDARVEGGRLYIGDAAVLDVPGISDRPVWAGIRPEGFLLDDDGPLECALVGVEVMGRDSTVIAAHPAFDGVNIRAIIPAESARNVRGSRVRFSVRPFKVHIFDRADESRLRFEVK
jgi:multiple sugar transport system ATP-binding protein